MSDRLGRKRLFILTLLLYLIGTGLAAFVTGHHTGWLVFFYLTRFVAGMGIGGQYSAINSAIDEVMPSKYRGRVDIWINGSYWAGAILGSLVSYIFLNHFAPNVGWRLAFLLGPVLAIFVIIVGPGAAREPALAGHARPPGRGRPGDGQDRGAGPQVRAGPRADRSRARRSRSCRRRGTAT